MTDDTGHSGSITFDLGDRNTFPLLVNALSDYAEVIDAQAEEQEGYGELVYSRHLARTALQAREMVQQIREAETGSADV